MLDYVKSILSKVSFDRRLFEKELTKAIALLVEHELNILKDWCYRNFSSMYHDILNKHFQTA
ncbi:hypothetical protein [Marivirga arenosa]|uniref:Uncharacterized protein n=1 Tax=Marivirga arenosa TaxID=3059076 RepID=A0AA51N490_9BACT|nr:MULTISPECIES: hypothetical protein [unclassified Marivirga]WKK79125.1 hypothetical protein QYS47_16750 [Marivirga sp. BKB1-2]WMN05982.1 hypothetical protein QYS48_31185 [Marivirga sp. ABR2-2]